MFVRRNDKKCLLNILYNNYVQGLTSHLFISKLKNNKFLEIFREIMM